MSSKGNFEYVLPMSIQTFNLVRFVIITVVLASVVQLVLDWVISEQRKHKLAFGSPVLVTGKPWRFMKSSSSGAHRSGLVIFIVLILYTAEALMEFGSGSVIARIPAKGKEKVLPHLGLNEKISCSNNDNVPCFSYESISNDLLQCIEHDSVKYRARYTELKPSPTKKKSYELKCPMTAYNSIWIESIRETRSDSFENTNENVDGIFYQSFSSLSEPVPVKVLGTGIFDTIHTSSTGFRLELEVSTTAKQLDATCEAFCKDTNSRDCDTGIKELRNCFITTTENEGLVMIGNIKFMDNGLEILPLRVLLTGGFFYNDYSHIFEQLIPVFWGSSAKKIMDEALAHLIVFIKINGKYDTPAREMEITASVNEVERASIGPMFLAGAILYSVCIGMMIAVAFLRRRKTMSYNLGWLVGEGSFIRLWYASVFGYSNHGHNNAEISLVYNHSNRTLEITDLTSSV